MSDKKSGEENVRKLTKTGNKSIGLTLPIEERARDGIVSTMRVKAMITAQE